MIELVDAHIKSRLEIIKFGGVAVTVYDYAPQRDHEETKYPCAAFFRHEIVVGLDNSRPDSYLYTASETTKEIVVPLIMGGGPLSGPIEYIRKPYPVPVDITYEIQALATNKAHATRLIESIFAVFPSGYMPQIGSQFPLFVYSDHVNLDELEKPLFVNVFFLNVYDLWVDRFEAETHKSIETIQLQDQAQFEAIGG